MFLHDLVAKPVMGLPCDIPYGDETFNWQYVEDVAQLILMASRVGRTQHRNFNTGGDFRSMHDAVTCVERLCPKAQIVLKPGKTGIPWLMDASVLQKEIGYCPSTTLEEGLRKSVCALRRQMKLSAA